MGHNDPQLASLEDNLVEALIALRDGVNQFAILRDIVRRFRLTEISSWEAMEKIVTLVGTGDLGGPQQGSQGRHERERQSEETRKRLHALTRSDNSGGIEAETVPPTGNPQMQLPESVSGQSVREGDAAPQPGQEDDGPSVYGV